MKTNNIWVLIVALSFLIFQVPAYSEGVVDKGVVDIGNGVKGIRGELMDVNLDSKSISILPEGSENPNESLNVIVPLDSEFNGFGDLTELRAGDEVSIEAHENVKNGLLEARSIAIVKIKLRDTVL